MNIPANIPFELIFIVLFFVLPALSSLFQRLQRRNQQRPSAETRPTRPVRADTAGPSANTDTRSDTTDIPKWLEEAQRRVREAQESETDKRRRRRTQTAKPPAPKPQATRPLVQPRPPVTRPAQTRPAPASLEDYRPQSVSLERTATPTGRPVTTPAPPLRVQRLSGQKSATLRHKMRFDEPTLMNGFVWHQILSPPLSQSRRNRLSRRRP